MNIINLPTHNNSYDWGSYKNLTVLNIGGVSMGSLASNIMLASASIVARLLASSSAKIEKVTKPCPVVMLLGGRNPILGSAGGSPKEYITICTQYA